MSTAPVQVLPAVTTVPRLRLTRRGRAVFTTLAAAPLVLAALAFMLNGGIATATVNAATVNAATSTDLTSTDSYVTVAGGESLWQLAETLAPSEDTREVVAQLLRYNDLPSADVYPGQQLAVPAQYQ